MTLDLLLAFFVTEILAYSMYTKILIANPGKNILLW